MDKRLKKQLHRYPYYRAFPFFLLSIVFLVIQDWGLFLAFLALAIGLSVTDRTTFKRITPARKKQGSRKKR
ncbi:hypothetical protein COT72_04355 [archaeon CG10_big_fil_rev_8_21_14_0_10_43_11]|nr:MAG: hypothetical protein COT72_04355 [archaeon CG10_big_fil_rev_8_21_14_0_10_43_11]